MSERHDAPCVGGGHTGIIWCQSIDVALLYDNKSIPEVGRVPATQVMLSAFVAYLAAAYLGRMISGYLNGMQAWHILHSLPWVLEKKEMDTMLWAAKKFMLSTLIKKKRSP